MKILLPTRKCESTQDGKIEVIEQEIEFDLITSLASQIRYESVFPQLAQKEELVDYTLRIQKEPLSQAKWLSQLKVLYCWINTDLTFLQFVDLFAQPNEEYIKKLTNRLSKIFDSIMNDSAEKN